MMVGRVGPLAVAISLFGSSQKIMYRYPTEEIFVDKTETGVFPFS
ncbi:MAG: hypothetical protein M5U34_39230 [Chloroflexi bacterium]|nr:hypothetical protein [Chloroflexota bacterium]